MLFFFLDGVGLGDNTPRNNPLITNLPQLAKRAGGVLSRELRPVTTSEFIFTPISATLGHPGLPHSATGQATLLTGVNAAEVMGRHYGPWPGPTLKQFLQRTETIFDIADFRFANAYPDGYFASVLEGSFRRNSLAFAAAGRGQPGYTEAQYRAGRGVAVDLHGKRLGQRSTPLEEAQRAVALADEAPLVFMDFWITDHFGHAQNMDEAGRWLLAFDSFVAETARLAPDALIIITSDHGNVEDATDKRHTRNQVPLVVLGPGAATFASATSLLSLKPLISEYLQRR